MRFSNFSFAFTMIKAQCPDQRLNAQCESVCIENFSICMETCEDSRLALISLNDKEPKTYFRSCQSQCNRVYVSCFEYCPCNEQCLAGCIDCENSICKGILVLNTFRFKLIHFKVTGRNDYVFGQMTHFTHAFFLSPRAKSYVLIIF